MNKKELKNILKPLVKECIKEVIFEGGIISGIVAEVAQGMQQGGNLLESKNNPLDDRLSQELELQEKRELLEKQRQDRIKKLNESAGSKLGGVNIFEGTTPTKAAPANHSTSAPGALAGVDPNDAGVDISGIAALAGGSWKRTMGNKR